MKRIVLLVLALGAMWYSCGRYRPKPSAQLVEFRKFLYESGYRDSGAVQQPKAPPSNNQENLFWHGVSKSDQ